MSLVSSNVYLEHAIMLPNERDMAVPGIGSVRMLLTPPGWLAGQPPVNLQTCFRLLEQSREMSSNFAPDLQHQLLHPALFTERVRILDEWNASNFITEPEMIGVIEEEPQLADQATPVMTGAGSHFGANANNVLNTPTPTKVTKSTQVKQAKQAKKLTPKVKEQAWFAKEVEAFGPPPASNVSPKSARKKKATATTPLFEIPISKGAAMSAMGLSVVEREEMAGEGSRKRAYEEGSSDEGPSKRFA